MGEGISLKSVLMHILVGAPILVVLVAAIYAAMRLVFRYWYLLDEVLWGIVFISMSYIAGYLAKEAQTQIRFARSKK
jgi:hypothetical protein